MSKVLKCSRCGRRYRDQSDWNSVVDDDGRITALVCSDCQTPLENAEAVINEATLDYGTDGSGRLLAKPKAEDPCVVCLCATDTGLGFTGEAEYIHAALMTLGLSHDRAFLMLESEPGMVPAGELTRVFRVCEDCVAKCNAGLDPGVAGLKVGPVSSPVGVPGYCQREGRTP